jgi:hypothetical protein
MKTVVIGGTGLIGSKTVAILGQGRHVEPPAQPVTPDKACDTTTRRLPSFLRA